MKKHNIFLNFMLLWSTLLLLLIVAGLYRFNRFLTDYEAAYQASRPNLDLEKYLSLIRSGDCNSIYALLTVKPALTAFETEADVKACLADQIAGHNITYVTAGEHTEDSPKYLIMADDRILAKLNLTRSLTENREYGFPVWEPVDFELYLEAPQSFLIQSPSHYTVNVNGIPLDETSLITSGITLAEEQYVKEYASLPTCNRYYEDGLYLPPTVTATDDLGHELSVTYDTDSQMYIVPFTSYTPDREALEDYAIRAVEDYCEYVSQDLDENGLDDYFPTNSRLLYLIRHNSSRRFFAKHRSSDFQNVAVKNFILYSDEVFYCEVYVEQVLVMSYGSPEPEILPYTGRFYFVRIDDRWKIAGIVY